MSDGFHRYAEGTSSGRFAAGPVQRSRSAHGTGEVERGTSASLTQEGAEKRCATATGPARRIPSEAVVQYRKERHRIVRIAESRVHGAPPALPPGQLPLGERTPWRQGG